MGCPWFRAHPYQNPIYEKKWPPYGNNMLDTCPPNIHILCMFMFCHAPNNLFGFALVKHSPCHLVLGQALTFVELLCQASAGSQLKGWPDFWKFGNLELGNLEIWDPKESNNPEIWI